MQRYLGKTSGMTLPEYFAFLFELNVTLNLSDDELLIKALEEFPHRPDILEYLTYKRIRDFRARYNKGNLHNDAPRIPSFRYINGIIATNRNTVADATTLRLRLRTQLKRWKADHVKKAKQAAKERYPKPKKKVRRLSKASKRKRIREGVRRAHKAYSKRLKIQKSVAFLHGVSPWAD